MEKWEGIKIAPIMDFAEIQNWLLNLSERKKQIGISMVCVAAGAALLITYFQTEPSALSYVEAQKDFALWCSSPQDETLYANMKSAMRHVPALTKRYEAKMAQKLIDMDKLDEALVMADHSLSRVREDIPYHAKYAEVSFLIERGNFQEALEKAVALKEQMGSSFLVSSKGGSLLYLHNLLRIACLQQELKNRPGEKAAWEELEKFLYAAEKPAQILLNSFSEKQINLTQYITARKNSLSH